MALLIVSINLYTQALRLTFIELIGRKLGEFKMNKFNKNSNNNHSESYKSRVESRSKPTLPNSDTKDIYENDEHMKSHIRNGNVFRQLKKDISLCYNNVTHKAEVRIDSRENFSRLDDNRDIRRYYNYTFTNNRFYVRTVSFEKKQNPSNLKKNCSPTKQCKLLTGRRTVSMEKRENPSAALNSVAGQPNSMYNSSKFRLVNDDRKLVHYGFLEVRGKDRKGRKIWRTVCGVDWDAVSADLACRAMNYEKGTTVRNMMGFSEYNHRTDDKYINCEKSHGNFDNCYNIMQPSEECRGESFIPAYLRCLKANPSSVKSMKETEDGVHHAASYMLDGKLIPISAEGWNDLATNLLCRHLGWAYGTYITKVLQKPVDLVKFSCKYTDNRSLTINDCKYMIHLHNQTIAVNCFMSYVHRVIEPRHNIIIRQLDRGNMNITMIIKKMIKSIVINAFSNVDFECEQLSLEGVELNLLEELLIGANLTMYMNFCNKSNPDTFTFINFTYYTMKNRRLTRGRKYFAYVVLFGACFLFFLVAIIFLLVYKCKHIRQRKSLSSVQTGQTSQTDSFDK
ncbi:hypothetical protein HELRODRAFT_161707 [Helobdella robusta]|uniref:SRCR domain-containing protein n=1 Tax=Helobdella robusta TaxID=6412 RepID=T1ERT2_HELRO|nr:hypothetical protein HELRODRAFT_161707 [Helobdella robusta]ESO02436.1 hypothetical protein HELRODRAFT_161707 [Helobdella robusta]